jgi:hypothetical protein
MRNNPYNIIKSVMGFDLTCKVQDENGHTIKSGIIYSDYVPNAKPKSINQMINKKFWTSFNQDLYNKLVDYKNANE